jgi:hypothetical protein
MCALLLPCESGFEAPRIRLLAHDDHRISARDFHIDRRIKDHSAIRFSHRRHDQAGFAGYQNAKPSRGRGVDRHTQLFHRYVESDSLTCEIEQLHHVRAHQRLRQPVSRNAVGREHRVGPGAVFLRRFLPKRVLPR